MYFNFKIFGYNIYVDKINPSCFSKIHRIGSALKYQKKINEYRSIYEYVYIYEFNI